MPTGNGTNTKARKGNAVTGLIERSVQKAAQRPGLLRRFVHVGQVAWAGMQRNQLTRMAAALSYRTIFGLIPMLVVSLVLLTAYSSQDTRKDMVYKVLDFAGLSVIAVPEAAAGDAALVPGMNIYAPMVAAHASAAEQAAAAPAKRQRLDDWIASLLDRVSAFRFGTVSLIGFLTLFYAALSMMVEVEHSFNQIYNAPEGRSWVRRLTQYWTMLTLGMIFLVASFTVTASIRVWVEQAIDGKTAGVPFAGPLMVSLVTAMPISTLMFLIVYSVIPNTRVQFGPALTGALFAGILWELAKNGFAAYVSFSAGYAQLYGTIALIPLFLLWVYVTWLITLAGLQLAAAVQSYRLASAQGLTQAFLATLGLAEDVAPARRLRVVDTGSILVVAMAVAERFAKGKTSGHADIAAETGADELVVSDMLERLAGAGILLRVSDAEQEGTYTLARPPAQIEAVKVLELAHAPGGTDRLSSMPVMCELTKARSAALAGKSLADLLGLAPPAATHAAGEAPAGASPVAS
ncbi:MAG: YihY/virulence factor BrkB family protein [Phycisphaerales bacterium]|nr:YihY/virulence factor BrkB family protein [Phycisphaerales bacterium]